MIVGFEKVLSHAEQTLKRKAHVRPEDRLELFKKFLKVEDQRLAMQHRYGLEGIKTCQRRAQLMDLLIQHIHELALEERAQTHSADASACALVAVGGYGRGELNFHSDIDIMFLFPNSLGEHGKFIVNKVLYWLWDLGMTVGHSARTISEAVQISATDLVSRTALFEARFISGDRLLLNHLTEKLEQRFARVPRVVQSYVEQKLSERRERHARFGASMYLQEPNVKESIGGIRDLHNVFWVLRLKYGSIGLENAKSHHLLSERETMALERSYDFLLAVRNELHLCSAKKMDILTRPYQPKIAAAFGFKDKGDRTGAELFMKKYYLHVRTVAFLSASILSKLQEPPSLAQRSLRFLRRKELESGLVQIDNTLFLGQNDPELFRNNPLFMLKIFSTAQERNAVIHEDVKALIRNNLFLVEKKFQSSPDAAALFRQMLSRKGSVGRILRTMHEIGFLGKYIPEFGKITCHVQDSEYHRYTTDEHTLKAIECVDELYRQDSRTHESLRHIARELPHPELLTMALVLHDLGKLDPEDHVSLGLILAQKVLKRMAYGAEDSEKIYFLIREHLSMSHIAQRRDLEDDSTVMDFSVLVKTTENLRALTILSFADASAVGPGIWTPWKEALIIELYAKTKEWLAGSATPLANTPEMLHETAQKVFPLLQGTVPLQDIENHLQRMSSRYPIFTAPPLIAKHVALVAALGTRAFVVDHAPLTGNETILEITVCTHDRLGLFAHLAGCFTLNDLNIVGAQINTRSDGIVLDTFRVSDVTGTLPIQGRYVEKFKASLQKVLDGTLDLEAAIKNHEAQLVSPWEFKKKIPPVVLLDNQLSSSKTVLEIQAMDRLGLLFHISKVLSSLGVNISAAKISTERSLAYDVFYITDKQGNKIVDPALQQEMIRIIQSELA